ncbi:MAG: DNA (cytosine-5-)-methyltransferase, partial [Coriobacteriia bacterium]|nr:DNA (cytosine-5-)-methyltransferase [Coriobacteriia bacterium]
MPIPNHYSAKMSALDLAVARCVPAGGNWKDVPDSIGCARVTRIREDYAVGKASRSTYYGRLRADRPSYTINTYFSRPGNGCHLHYDFARGQHRVLSEREAARLQSFPDDFVFCGSHRAIQQQIGNAVPPLLAYQIARALPFTGNFVDLFCGAGGLALGFVWAGWTPVVSNDFETAFIETHNRNFGTLAVQGDIRDEAVVAMILAEVGKARVLNPEAPLLILGGPPCQGFSTAGNKRSMEDDRNHLFLDYRNLVDLIRPDGFVFENVMGLLNMQDGQVFDSIKTELERPDFTMTWRILDAEQYA